MAVKKDVNRLNPFDNDLDPAVVAAIGSPEASKPGTVYDHIAKARKMTPAQRKKALRDAARPKASYDIPASVVAVIDELADAFQVPKSQVIAFFFMHGAQQLLRGEINVTWALTGSRSPRFVYQLKIPDQPTQDEIQAFSEKWKKTHGRQEGF